MAVVATILAAAAHQAGCPAARVALPSPARRPPPIEEGEEEEAASGRPNTDPSASVLDDPGVMRRVLERLQVTSAQRDG